MKKTGNPFDVTDTVAAVDALLGAPLPANGPTQGEPSGAEGWSGSHGAGFRLRLLWESRSYVGVPGPEWDAAQAEAEEYLAALTAALAERWGPHREVSMRAFLLREIDDESVLPLFAELRAFDLYGELAVWGPVASPSGPRWVAVSLSQCDGDAPHLMVAAVTDVPIEELEEAR
ncbi:hypothetical protein E2C00_27355 [Streptomyces sp. WAC05374]|uniref:hypothetical protein n=1 Tax=Streptomyces sp. WAC05374 TaxID=2487420 RepID=UPI000F85E47B|nr:hypothetical protein [Streptomyces sp. WAC05374]RST05731.1 hypothetical protein EF905_32835 [Streptomyces sp. WAC05374]TDF43237.1 hypothetical protein E2B92_20210 [Streptomyces sp. WAC05374]TDF51023.1 hypothetical protein E2C00_27355 [Streptomyces sp. WAC05374]TDF52234.1 hypothetical protein E2C02_21810 [Streptomyces sp. WAC05374]